MRFRVTDGFDVVCDVCVLSRWVAGGLLMGAFAKNVSRDVEFGEEAMSTHVCLMRAAGGRGEVQSD